MRHGTTPLLAALAGTIACQAKPSDIQRPPPRLVVVVVIDQLRQWDLHARRDLWRYGLKRLLDEGRSYNNATHSHARTETAAGHATIATGVTPRWHGVVDKRFYDDDKGAVVGVCDFSPATDLCSPTVLKSPTLGDRLKQALPDARVVALGQKDRSATLMGGSAADMVAWQDGFTLTGHTPIPPSLSRLHDRRLAGSDKVTRVWEQPRWPNSLTLPADDVVGERSASLGRVFPHHVPNDHGPNDSSSAPNYWAWFATPDADRVLRELATATLTHWQLGQDSTPDILWLSFGGFDLIGHQFGPDSLERLAALADLDIQLGALLTAIEHRLGKDNVLLALTSDHGVAPLITRAPPPSRRVQPAELVAAISAELNDATAVHAMAFPSVKMKAGTSSATIDRAVASLTRLPFVERAFNNRTLRRDRDVMERLVWENTHTSRSADITVVLKPYHAIHSRHLADEGAEHGSPWLYDRHVPIILWGQGIDPATISTPVHVIDLTRTLADRLGLPVLEHGGEPLP